MSGRWLSAIVQPINAVPSSAASELSEPRPDVSGRAADRDCASHRDLDGLATSQVAITRQREFPLLASRSPAAAPADKKAEPTEQQRRAAKKKADPSFVHRPIVNAMNIRTKPRPVAKRCVDDRPRHLSL